MTLTAYEPKLSDLWFKQKMMSDEKTMSYNHDYGGTIPFPKDKWQEWYNRWIANHDGKRYYRYLCNEQGTFVGEMSYRYDREIDGYMADIVIYSEDRGKGCGSLALDMLCFAAKEKGISFLYDDIAIDNPSVGLFIRHGFVEIYRTDKIIMLKKEL